MTVSTAFGVLAVIFAATGLACVAVDWWLRRTPRPVGRHRAPAEPVPGLSATRLLLEARAAADRAPALPHPTREQLRQAAGR